jgi:hypothetical protein
VVRTEALYKTDTLRLERVNIALFAVIESVKSGELQACHCVIKRLVTKVNSFPLRRIQRHVKLHITTMIAVVI